MIMTTAILAVLGGAAAAQSRNCGPRAHVVERLTDQYGETRQSIGLAANNSVVEVYASTQTGTWTITVTMPSGVTCLVAAGRNFEELAEAQPAAGDDV
ncbi:MAG: hypothetical protein AAGF60_05660 [Pseudomonadota bacterium]